MKTYRADVVNIEMENKVVNWMIKFIIVFQRINQTSSFKSSNITEFENNSKSLIFNPILQLDCVHLYKLS